MAHQPTPPRTPIATETQKRRCGICGGTGRVVTGTVYDEATGGVRLLRAPCYH